MLDFIKSTLIEAAKIFQSTDTEILHKKIGGGNWVTKKDIAIEKCVIELIQNRYPTHTILSEETEQERDALDKKNLWIFDPLDGTTNAFYGLPHYAISLAFSQNGQVKMGGIYNVPGNILYWAEKGKGAYVQSSAKDSPTRLFIRGMGLKNALVCAGSPYSSENFAPIHRLMKRVHGAGARLIILGSAVIACSYVAEGKLSLYFEKGLKPWDIAATSLLVEEAGGVAQNIEGKLDILHPRTFVCGSKTIVNEFLTLSPPHRRREICSSADSDWQG